MGTWYRYSSFYATVKLWTVEFKWGRDSTEDDPQPGCPKISTTDGQVDANHHMFFNDRCFTVHQIAKFIGISSSSVHTV